MFNGDKSEDQLLPIATIFKFLSPPSAWSAIFYSSVLMVATVSMLAIPLPGFILPFETPPYFNVVFYKNALWLGLVLSSLDHLLKNMVSNVDTMSGVKYATNDT